MNAERNPAPISAANGECAIQVYTLGRFSVVINGVSLHSSYKVQKKPLAILKLLIAFGGREVAVDRICETLWRNVDGDYSLRALKTNLYRLRKLLQSKKALLCRGGDLTLNAVHVSVDMWKLQRLLTQIERLIKNCAIEPVEIQDLCEQAMRLYEGPFLANETGEWAIAPRDQLRRRILRMLYGAGQALDNCGRSEIALSIYHKGLEINELAEEFYQKLMVYYATLGHRTEAMMVYQRCRERLALSLNVKPMPRTETLYLALQRGDWSLVTQLCR